VGTVGCRYFAVPLVLAYHKKNGIGVIAFTSKVVDGDVLTIERE